MNLPRPRSHRADGAAGEKPGPRPVGQHAVVLEGELPGLVAASAIRPPPRPVVLIGANGRAPWRAWARELTARGCQVLVTHDSLRARALAAGHVPRVALLAFAGDGFDNYWLAQELRRLAQGGRIAIVVWGHAEVGELAGADACVPPQTTLDRFVEKVLTLGRGLERAGRAAPADAGPEE